MKFHRVLITGANGLLGQQLVQRMSAFPEYDVLATGRDETPQFLGASCGYTMMDVTSPTQVRRLFEDFAPSIVINSAAMTEVDLCEREREACWKVNVEGVENLARNCKSTGARLIQVSTDYVFDGQDGPYREDARPNPLNFYGKSKLAAENIVRQLGTEQWGIARTVVVYGTGTGLKRGNLALWALDQFEKGKPFKVFTDQWRCFTYAPELALGIERMVRFGKSGVYHLSGPEYLPIYAFIQAIARVFDLDADLVQPTPSCAIEQLALRPPHTGFITLKAESELGFRHAPLEEALRHLAQALPWAVPSSSSSSS